MDLLTNFEEIDTIEVVDNETVYDLTVEDNHNFFANELLVHNCGEIILSAYDSCRLMLVNLTSFVKNAWTDTAEFDYGHFRIITRKAQRLMDDMIDLEIEQIDKILAKIDNDPESDDTKFYERSLWHSIRQAAVNGRRTGLGITGLGDALAMLGQRYGSDQSIDTTEEIYKWLSLASYEESINLAEERGAFPVYDLEKEKDHPFLNQVLRSLTLEMYDKYVKYGRRNIANTTTAPAGSVSCLTQTTSGIEPAFMLHYSRRKKITADEDQSLVTFIDDVGDRWTEFNVYHHGFKQYLDHTSNFYSEKDRQTRWKADDIEIAVKHSPYAGATANEIDWRAKVKLQAAAQKWICHAISNTTNLPNDIDVETVKDIYMMGWELGCKGVTVYRDGSRSGVLVSTDDKGKQEAKFEDRDAPKRPDTLECDIHHTAVKFDQWVVLVGLLEGRPYEVLGGKAEQIEIPKKYKTGQIIKRNYKTVTNKYDLVMGEGDDQMVVKDLVDVFENANYAGYTRTISLALRHGVPVQYLVEQMQKDKEADMYSFSKAISRCLKKYIADGTKASVTICPDCKAEGSIVYQEGCATCTNCSFSKCG
jgi:ribonucleoside-diphosphate reductase alpha chain